jgi:hypothetical protein
MNGSPSQKKVLTTQINQIYGLYNNYSLAPIIPSSKEETILLPIHFLPTCSINSYYRSVKVKMKMEITVTHSFILVEGNCKSNMDHILFLVGGGLTNKSTKTSPIQRVQECTQWRGKQGAIKANSHYLAQKFAS